MDIEKIKRLDLADNEAKIYLVLLKLGKAQAGELSKEAQVNRTTTYDALERLIEKGLVTYTFEANKKVFRPVNPKRLVEIFQEKENLARDILPKLESLYKSSEEKEETSIYKGKKGIKSILNNILKNKEYVAFGSSGKFMEIMKHDFELFQNQKKKLNINSRVILAGLARKTEQVKMAHSKFRFIPKEYTSPTTTFIYGNYTAIIIWGEVPTAIVIKSKEVSESYMRYFELLWKIAKP